MAYRLLLQEVRLCLAHKIPDRLDGGAEHLTDALADGVSPADIGILARRHDLLDPVEKALHLRGIRTQRLQRAGTWEPDSVKLTTLHASKGHFQKLALQP